MSSQSQQHQHFKLEFLQYVGIVKEKKEVEDRAQARQGHCWQVRRTKNLAEFNSQAASAESSQNLPFSWRPVIVIVLKLFSQSLTADLKK